MARLSSVCVPLNRAPRQFRVREPGQSRTVASTRLGAEAFGVADTAATRAAIGADIPGWRADADTIEARAAAADVHAVGARGAEGQAAATTPSALARAATADRSERAGVKADAAVARVTQQVDAHSAAVGLPGRARRRSWILPGAHKADVGDVGADTRQPHAIEAARGGILPATAAFPVAGARGAEGGARAAEAIGIAGLAATTAARADLRALRAIARAIADLVLVTVADAAAPRTAGLPLLGAGGLLRERCRADPVHARLSRRAGLAADSAVDRAGHQVGAVVVAVGRARGALRSDARAVLAVGKHTGVLRADRTTNVTAGPAVLVIAAQVATQSGRPAIGATDRAICPLADSATALDANKSALADGSAGTAVVDVRLKIDANAAAVGLTGRAYPRLIRSADPLHAGEAGTPRVADATVVRIGLEIDAGSATVIQTTGTQCRACAAAASVAAGLARGTGKAACPAVPRVAPEIGAVAVDALRDVWRLAAIGPFWWAPAAPGNTGQPSQVGAYGIARAAVVTVVREIDAHAVAARQAAQALA
jgi:hypothetical protein